MPQILKFHNFANFHVLRAKRMIHLFKISHTYLRRHQKVAARLDKAQTLAKRGWATKPEDA